MRRYVSIQVLLALVPVVFSAPFLHLHGHEDANQFVRTHLRQAFFGHVHFSTSGYAHGPSAAFSAWEDEDPVYLDWLQGGAQVVPDLEIVLVETTVIPAPEQTAFWTEVPTHRAHDPPLIVSLSPRSPPAARISPLGA